MITIFTLGNPDRGDDGVARHVGELLQRRHPDLDVIDIGNVGSRLLEHLHGVEHAIIIDACSSGTPGQWIHCQAGQLDAIAAGTLRPGTHGFDLCRALDLARALDQLPAHTELYLIPGENFTLGAPLTPKVAAAAEAVTAVISHRLTAVPATP